MRTGVKVRLIAFLVLSAVGIVYASANYLGLVDRVLGRGYDVTAVLSGTGGLYEGSLVTYRGVEIGKVTSMQPKGEGVAIKLALDDEAKVPQDSPFFVHNGSAVGEQYLDFEPGNDEGPFLGEGDTIEGQADSLPVDEADLLVNMDQFVGSVNRQNLRTVISELGTMFYETGRPLQDLIDGGTQFIDEAARSKAETIRLLKRGRTVLRTQQASSGSIRDFADGLAQFTTALRASDGDLRSVIADGPATMNEIQTLMEDLEPILPVLLSNVVAVNEITAIRIPNLEQLLVTYPVVISSGFTGTTPDGFGHVHLDYTSEPPPCTKGYLPPSRWRRGDQTSDVKPYLKAHCASGPPYVMRGSNYHPEPGGSRSRVAPFDPSTGTVYADGQQYVLGSSSGGGADGSGGGYYGGETWEWMLLGPDAGR